MKIVKMKMGFWLLPEYHKNKMTNGEVKGFYWLWWHFITKSIINISNSAVENLKQLNIKEIEGGRNY